MTRQSRSAEWRRLAERHWGTVRKDYSEAGDAWSCFTHEDDRSFDVFVEYAKAAPARRPRRSP